MFCTLQYFPPASGMNSNTLLDGFCLMIKLGTRPKDCFRGADRHANGTGSLQHAMSPAFVTRGPADHSVQSQESSDSVWLILTLICVVKYTSEQDLTPALDNSDSTQTCAAWPFLLIETPRMSQNMQSQQSLSQRRLVNLPS